MRNFFYGLLCLLILSSCNTTKVRLIIEMNNSGTKTTETRYNRKGSVVSIKEFDSSGEDYTYKEVFKYDKQNNLVKSEQIGNDGSLIDINTYTYNRNNKLLENHTLGCESYENKELVLKKVCEYDSVGQLITETNYTCSNKVMDAFYYLYDEEGALSEKIERDRHGDFSYRWFYYYDSINRLTHDTCFSDWNKEDIKKSTKYNYTEGGTNITLTDYSYGSSRTIIKTTTTVLNKIGEIIKEESFDYNYSNADGSPIIGIKESSVYKRDYDVNGNTLKLYIDNSPDHDILKYYEVHYFLF